MSSITKRADFSFIRYANVWEDADVLLAGLKSPAGARVLSIASAGDNSFSLLATNPEIVVAVDVNEVQLWLVEFKKMAIRNLDRDACVAFLGFTDSPDRLETYQRLKSELPEKAREFFDTQKEWIGKGIIHAGKFEKYFRTFAGKILPWIHNKRTTAELMRVKSAQDQESFYATKWNSFRWRLLFKIFFSKWVMGRLGRDPEFLEEVEVPVAEFIFKQAERHLKSTGAQHNHILHYNLTGNFGNHLPHYLQRDSFDIIKNNLSKLIVFKGYAEEAIQQYGPFQSMNLSNIFEYMDAELFRKVSEGLVHGLNNGGRMVYWNLMVPRKISRIFPIMELKQDEINKASAVDKGFFYHSIVIEEKA